MTAKNGGLVLAHSLIAVGLSFLYMHHIRSAFYSYHNFGQLSGIGRDALLKNEDALYFSFYRSIVEEKNFWFGYENLLNITNLEYPSSVNVVKRFHVLPELIAGYLYHGWKQMSMKLGISTYSCDWMQGQENNKAVYNCYNAPDPFIFYLEIVWFLGGITILLIYIYGSFLSESSLGGFYAVMLYTIFHKHASKIYKRPVARENFGYPFMLWQMLFLTLCMQKSIRRQKVSLVERFLMISKITILTTVSQLSWQFSSVIFATQIIVMIAPWSFGIFSKWFCIDFAISQFLASMLTYNFMLQNRKILFGWQNGPALALLSLSVARMNNASVRQEISTFSFRNVFVGIFLAFSWQGSITEMLEKSGITGTEDNPYSIYRDLVFHWTLQRKTNFTTTLLACKPDFSNYRLENIWELIKMLLIKPYCLFGVVLLAKFLRQRRVVDASEIKEDQKERAKKYVLEDFLEENRILIQEMSKKETEKDLDACLKVLEECNYNYNKYKIEVKKLKKNSRQDRASFFNDVKKLKDQISKNEKQKEKILKDNENDINEKLHEDSEGYGAENLTEETDKESSNAERKDLTEEKFDKNLMEEYEYYFLFNIVQLVIFTCLGLTIRKLFFLCYTQICIVAPTLCLKFWYRKHANVFRTISILVFITSIVDPGIQNIEGEYLPNQTAGIDEIEHLLEWININTEKNAVFGGPAELIATVHLATKRPIINHPHLEMLPVSERTEAVYSFYSRQQSSEIYNQCVNMKIQYLIISFQDCVNYVTNDCDALAIWDDMQPNYKKYPQFCAEMINKNIPSFLKVFSNKHYGIVKLFSQSVQLNLSQNKLPEREI